MSIWRAAAVGMASAAAMALAPMAFADPSPSDQARAALDQALAGPLKDDTYRTAQGQALGERIGHLRMSEVQLWRVPVTAGRMVRFVAACDDDCQDVDLDVIGPDGRPIGRDIEVNATPVVAVAAPVAGTYSVRAWVAECETEPCAVALRVQTGGQAATAAAVARPPAPEGNPLSQVRRYLSLQAQKHTDEGFRADSGLGDQILSLAAEDDGKLLALALQAGVTYRVMAVCEDRCGDVDLDLYDPAGRLIGRDVAVSDNPYIEVTPSVSGSYAAYAWLADCKAAHCAIGVRAYLR